MKVNYRNKENDDMSMRGWKPRESSTRKKQGGMVVSCMVSGIIVGRLLALIQTMQSRKFILRFLNRS